MANSTIDEDSFDMETLQAQIDMSMAFAQNLVSSWVKPSHKLPAKSNRDMEAELQEYMRRPPRLGVGAAIPETQNLSREAVRLKGQLVGKNSKRPREEDAVTKDKSDDEEESRAGAIRKKARVDPFEERKKKKKNKKLVEFSKVTSTTTIPPVSPPKPAKTNGIEEVKGVIVDEVNKSVPLVPSTPQQKMHGKTLSDLTKFAQPTNGTVPTGQSNHAQSPAAFSPGNSKVVDISLIETPIISSRFQRSSQSPDVLKKTLLNLASHSGSESDQPTKVENPHADSSAKKKRKRKKKKKKTHTSTTDT